MDIVRSRRQVLQGLLKTACTTLTLSPYMLLNPDNRERLEKAILHPSRIDDGTLEDLSIITQGYRRLSKNASLDILSGISGHLRTIVQALKDPLPTATYRRLCSLTAESASILAGSLYDLREYELSWSYFSFAIRSASESGNTGLWGAIVGDMALSLIYWGHPQYVLPLLEHAGQADLHDAGLRAWHAAIEAEAHTILGDEDAFTRAIDRSKMQTSAGSLGEYTYYSGYDLFRQWGFEGACYVRLHKPELALQALQRSLDYLTPTAIRRHSTVLADIGNVYAQLGDTQQASSYTRQSLDITLQTKSLNHIQRIYATRKELALRGNSSEVQDLDNQIAKTVAVIMKAREAV